MDISQKLSEILADPEKLSQVMQLAGGLVGGANEPSPQPAPPSNDLISTLGALDPKLVATLTAVLVALGREDERTSLMRALKPHLKSDRAERVDKAIRILRISGAIRTALGAIGGDNGVLKI